MPLLLATIVFLLLAGVGIILVRRSLEIAQAAERMEQVTRGAASLDAVLLRPVPHPHTGGAETGLARLGVFRHFEKILWQAGIYHSVSAVIALMLTLFAFGVVAASAASGDPLIALGAGFALAAVPPLYIRICRQRRLNAFLTQYPYALDLMKSSLEAGHTLQRGLQVVQDEFVDPLGGEFRAVVEQTRLGMPLNEALAEMLQRVPLDDLRLLVVAVKVQSEVGSSLAQIIGRLAEIVRTRQRLYSQIQALTAQSRMSGMVVGLLPVVVLAMFTLIQPRNTEMLFFDPAGRMLLKVAMGLDLGAFLIIRRILRVRY